MNITRKRKFIAAISLVTIMVFGIIIIYGFSANVDVLAAEPRVKAYVNLINPANGTYDDIELDIPTINEDFFFEIPYIPAGEVFLIGRISLSPDNSIAVNASAEYRNDAGFFIALSDSPNIQTVTGTMWEQFWGSKMITSDYFNFTSDSERTVYLYIGGGFGGTLAGSLFISDGNRFFQNEIKYGNLSNVIGKVFVADE